MPTSPQFCIERLAPSRHRREEFECESPELTTFLRQRARKEMDAYASACFVLTSPDDPGRIAGFYTLSSAEITATDLPATLVKHMPRYTKLPATLLGRLARDLSFRGQGLGDRLMHDALQRAFNGSREIGSVALVTDPKDEAAARFYGEFGFRTLDGKKRQFLPMPDIAQLIESKTP